MKVNLMTYAVAVRLQRGVVFAADTRTNAGIDNVSQFRKLHFWRRTGDRVLVLLTAGNLAVSQSVISIINEQLSPEVPADRPTLMNVSSMYRAARLVGDAVREVRAIDGPSLDANKTGFSVSCILGGQVGDEAPRLFQIYDEGNFIEATDDTPYLQIGEHKYGKPILDRVVHPEMRLGEVAKLILLSFDATLRSDLSVGMPIDLLLYERDTLDVRRVRRIDENDDYYRNLSNQLGRGPQSGGCQHGRVQRLIVNGRHHARGPRLLFPMQGCFSFIRIKSVEGKSNPSVFAALSQHPSATIDGRLPRAHENLAAFPEISPANQRR